MSPRSVGVLVGVLVFVVSLAVMYAGSDHPPPPGFMFVALACVGLGLLMGALVPIATRMRNRGRPLRALADYTGAGAGYLGCTAVALTLLNASSTDLLDKGIFLAVAVAIGAVGGLACGGCTIMLLGLRRSHT